MDTESNNTKTQLLVVGGNNSSYHPSSPVSTESAISSIESSSLESKLVQPHVSKLSETIDMPNVLDRSQDAVYTATTNVVKAIMILSQGVEKASTKDYLDLVKTVGFELRTLLASVDELSGKFSSHARK